ncbi:hypothetical protein [Nocardioides sp. B-3]|uniref:hypothetical protein n=1 Tax=Nocardioides sp. B-3 TaxID=2895565 RepID=UPI0021522A9A|nr:hypothetical protein [Nocardioides sp. B-3]UUZ61104.1 hypothetical protein LP418_10960 [Nocardioides sp. B-3]
MLDADRTDELCYVVNEWGAGTSLDIMLANSGPLARGVRPGSSPRWPTARRAHDAGLEHGRMVPENVLIDRQGQVRIIGFAVDAALHGVPSARRTTDLLDTVGVLYAALTGKWAGASTSLLPPAPRLHGEVLRPRRVRAGIPRPLDALCDRVINATSGHTQRSVHDLSKLTGVAAALAEFVGDPTGMAEAGPRSPPPPTQPVRRIEPLPPMVASPRPGARGARPGARGARPGTRGARPGTRGARPGTRGGAGPGSRTRERA